MFVAVQATKLQQAIAPKLVEYGPHIPTLWDLLEAGHFD